MFLWERELGEKKIGIGDFEPVKHLGLDSVFDFRMSPSHWLLEDGKGDSCPTRSLSLRIHYKLLSVTGHGLGGPSDLTYVAILTM